MDAADKIAPSWYFNIKSVDRRLSERVSPHFTVLDVGCGTGIDVFSMAERCAFVVGLDLGEDYPLKQVWTNAKKLKVDRKVQFIRASATNIPFDSCVFDATVCFSVIDHLPTKRAAAWAVREMARVTKVGGDVTITVPNFLFFLGTIPRLILTASKTGTFFEQRFTPTELKKIVSKAGLDIQEFDFQWPEPVERITIDNRLPPFLRGRIPVQAFFPLFRILGMLGRTSVLAVCAARIGFRSKRVANSERTNPR